MCRNELYVRKRPVETNGLKLSISLHLALASTICITKVTDPKEVIFQICIDIATH